MKNVKTVDTESRRLREDYWREKNWKRWGPYLAEREWATVREDYSSNGDCWEYFPHDHARSRAYRWGEDGILGITDRECRLCFSLAFWNGRDPILKERLFGLTNLQGNHGEDVKELYFYLDSTPTHSYMRGLYKYPQAEFPYLRLIEENAKRGRNEPEFELLDTGIFSDARYFDIYAEYAKNSPNDILMRFTVCNRAPNEATLHFLPTLWVRNTWSWGCRHEGCTLKPIIKMLDPSTLLTQHETLDRFVFHIAPSPGAPPPQLLFTENETNTLRLFGSHNYTPYVKDAFNEYVVHSRHDAINPLAHGTKAAAYYILTVPANGETSIRIRLSSETECPEQPFDSQFDKIFHRRLADTNVFYDKRIPPELSEQARSVAKQAYAGLLWNKQFYHYVIEDWLRGDDNMPKPPEIRKHGRNADWLHLYNRDVISMPDKWEYPWYASWDLAFHMLPLAHIDPDFAKKQLILFLREWYMHPNGQLPAYEFSFCDVNPPVHAWAAWRVYKVTGPRGLRDRAFLESAFQKLLMNFTWWVNRKDPDDKHIFSGGFLGLDNIGLFDRNRPLPGNRRLNQSDGTAWMAFYCGTMLSMALELAQQEHAYEDMASKFFEHFIAICDAINSLGGTGLWDEHDGFYYDQILHDGTVTPIKARSLVGLLPLVAVEVFEQNAIDRLPGFQKRMRWFTKNRKDLARRISYMACSPESQPHDRFMLAIPSCDRLERVLRYMLDENEFLSPFGLRSLSKFHADHPFSLSIDGQRHSIEYQPAESDTDAFGGNSNWRGPVWFPINYLIIEALQRYHHFYGDSLRVECPTGSGRLMNLKQVSAELASRLTKLFLPDAAGQRPCHGPWRIFADNRHWKNLLMFNEYFNSESGQGLGAAHQTGWTALVTRCFEETAQAQKARHAAKDFVISGT